MFRSPCSPRKGSSQDVTAVFLDHLELIEFTNVVEADLPEHELQRRVSKRATVAPRHNDGPDFVTQLQQRLEHAVVLMGMCDKRVVDLVGQVGVGISLDTAIGLIANHRIKQHVDSSRLNQDACVSEVADPHTRTVKASAGRFRLGGEER